MAFGSIWVDNQPESSVRRIDPKTNEVVKRISVGTNTCNLDVGEGAVWVSGVDSIVRIDPETNKVSDRLATESLGSYCSGLDVSEGRGLLVRDDDQAWSFDPATNKILDRLPVDHPALGSIDSGSFWVTSESQGDISRVDAQTNKLVKKIHLSGPANRFWTLEAFGAVWVSSENQNALYRIDPDTNEVVAKVKVGKAPFIMAAGKGSVWVSNHDGNSISRIDPDTNRVIQTINHVPYPAGLAFAEGDLWVALFENSKVRRYDIK